MKHIRALIAGLLLLPMVMAECVRLNPEGSAGGVPLFVAAQVRTTGDIRGRVFDPTGATVPGVSLQVKDLATGEIRTTTSDAIGTFVFLNLKSGVYELTASLTGFQTAVLPRVVVETARTTDVDVHLTVGALSETVEVTATSTPVLETTSNTISQTVPNDYVQKLPLAGRNTLPFAVLMAGAQTPGTNTRDSTFNGLPNASMNISIDGMNNNSQRWKSGGTSFFGFAPTRLDAIEEVSISTTGLGADAAAGGAMTIRFTTKRGTNEFHGKIFHQIENDALNANSFFNNARGLPKSKVRNNDFGGNLGGYIPLPFTRKRLYFFVNFEANPVPSTFIASQAILTPEAQRGIFKYIGTDNQVYSVNLLEIAERAGYPGRIDPTIQRILDLINSTVSKGTLLPSTTNLNQVTLQWRQEDYSGAYYPTARLDFQITPTLAWHGSWNLRHQQFDGEPLYPGLADKENRLLWANESNVTTYVASNVLDWNITPNILNTFTFGVQSNLENFNNHATPFVWRDQGIPRLGLPLITHPIPTGLPFPRNNPVWSISDTVSWVRNKHTFTFGMSYLYTSMYETAYGFAGIPSYNLGVVAADPVTAVLSGSNLPRIRSSDLSTAWALYALLTGRLSSVSGSRNVDEKTKQYRDFAPVIRRQAYSTGGVYFQDSYRVSPSLTLNYGLRWEISGTHRNTNGIYTDPGFEHLLGPSRQLFRPGVLDGVQDPQLFQRAVPYKSDKVNPAPNFGFAWNPSIERGILRALFGSGRKTVIRGGYGINYYDEGMNMLQFSLGNNPGLTQSFVYQPGMPGFSPGGLLLNSVLNTSLPFSVNPPSFSFPMSQSLFTFVSGIAAFKPFMHTPYVQSWTLSIQREIAPSTVLEARYVGNKSTHIWRTYSLAETNIFESGFLREFINAQNNLAISIAQGRGNRFDNQGLPGQVPLPLFEAAFGARGSQPALPAGSGFANGTFINQLRQGAAGALANTLATNNIYFCRLVGSAFAPCAALGFNAPGPYPINLFRANPFVTNTRLVDDNQWSTYHGLQIELRRSFSSGLTLNANYTWSKALGDYFGVPDSDNSEDYWTLRNRNLNKAPSPFDLRHTFTAFWTYELPFGRGRRFASGVNGVVDRIIGGWTLSGITRLNSGRVFRLVSGRSTFNNLADSGIILKNISLSELQKKIRQFSPGPNRNAYHVDPALVGPDGRANPQFFDFPTTPGQFGQFIYLYGTPLVVNDLALLKEIPLKERLKLSLQFEATNAFNHPVLNVGSLGGTLSIDSTSFGQTAGTLVGPRNIQIRAHITW
ncbi:MAG TPA: carboxypeptidase-like regulatory domain-containing protein [Blastocatellia bacterium]|nr:carboxypeptidase-like regulatory domain-containing protein [Blastocatellia bacterium]